MVWRGDRGYGLNGMTITLAPRPGASHEQEQVNRQQEYERQISHDSGKGSSNGYSNAVPSYTEENIYDTTTGDGVTPNEWDPVNPFSNAAAVEQSTRSPPPAYQGQGLGTDNTFAPPDYSQYDNPARRNPDGSQTFTHQVADRYRYSQAQKEEAVLYEPFRQSEARWDNLGQKDPSVLMESRQVKKYRKLALKRQQQQERDTTRSRQQELDQLQQQHQRQGLLDEDVMVPRPEGSLRPDSGTASGYYAGDRRSMNFLGGRNVGTLDV